jgi:hypothetical protein
MGTDDRRREELLERLLGPGGPEVTCEECFELLDEYVEAEAGGADPRAEMPAMAEHLRGCPACREDYESLLALVGREDAG